MEPYYVSPDGAVTLFEADALAVLAALAPNSVDACVTDPPYGLSQEPDAAEVLRHWLAGDAYTHTSKGFMGRSWDSFVPGPEYWRAVYRVLKPGGYVLAFSSTRTWDLLSMALRLAGFENRDTIGQGVPAYAWIHGQGFPKSLDISKAIDSRGGADIGWFGPWLREERKRRGISQRTLAEYFKTADERINHGGCVANWELSLNLPTPEQFNRLCQILDLPFDSIAAAEREVVGQRFDSGKRQIAILGTEPNEYDITVPATDAAKQWAGWGTALKPSWEVILMFRKPLIGTYAQNTQQYGTGGLNIDAARIAGVPWQAHEATGLASVKFFTDGDAPVIHKEPHDGGRWPSNAVFSHTEQCVERGTRRVKVLVQDRTNPLPDSNAIAIVQDAGHTEPGGDDEAIKSGITGALPGSGVMIAGVPFDHKSVVGKQEVNDEGPVSTRDDVLMAERDASSPEAVSQLQFALGDGEVATARVGFSTVVRHGRRPASALVDSGACGGTADCGDSSQSGSFDGEVIAASRTDALDGPASHASHKGVTTGGAARLWPTGERQIDAELCDEGLSTRYADTRDGSEFAASRFHDDSIHQNYDTEYVETIPDFLCDPSCPVAELDRQSGERKSGSALTGNEPSRTGDNGIYGTYQRIASQPYEDVGGASRFFATFRPDPISDDPGFRYVPKPSRAERDAGCEHLPARTGAELTSRTEGSAGLNSPRAGAGRTSGGRNSHETVKALDLMDHLVTLVTPPGGTVLDPFMGSGSTGCSAVRLMRGYRFIGVDSDSRSVEIAAARIRYWMGPLFALAL